MVSKTLASLDAWLARADEVLAEQQQYRFDRPDGERGQEGDQLTLFPMESA
jgi:hypothetical protein